MSRDPATDATGVCVRLVDRGRVTLPPPASRGQTFWLTSLGEGWLEMTTDAEAPNLLACVMVGDKNRFVLPRGYLRFRFGVAHEDTLISVVTARGPVLSALVFGLQHLPSQDRTRVANLVVAQTLSALLSPSSAGPGDNVLRGSADRGYPGG